MKVPYFSFDYMHKALQDTLNEAFNDVLSADTFLLGQQLAAFEQSFSEYCSVRYAIGTGSGYDALYIALKSLRLHPGDEVIVPVHTFIATWHAIANCGLQVIPADALSGSFNLDPSQLEKVTGPKTRAIIPVHMYGQSCRMDAITDFAREHNLYCIEDFAQSHGATFKGKKTGSMGDMGATSFYPVKNLGALGDGGAITTNSERLDRICRQLRNYGSEQKYYYEDIGVNSRLEELQAAVLNRKLLLLDEWNRQRRTIADYYNRELGTIEALGLPTEEKDMYHVYHLYVILTDKRDKLRDYLYSRGIDTLIHYPCPPHLQKAYKFLNYRSGDFPVAEMIADRALSLPCYPGLPEEHQGYIIECIKNWFR